MLLLLELVLLKSSEVTGHCSVHQCIESDFQIAVLYCVILCCIAARRKYCIELGTPWGSISVEKNMPSIKFYHDLNAGRNNDID